jgi:hypothetical protein|tara:strand:- start:211 stop:1068 length:858 start_codon:yes stop_codon:yes gene_type:complete
MTENTNPLEEFYRQPSIYITLPSKGKYYDSSVLTPTENSEYPVYPMTAKDEMLMKTPDALMGGSATIDVVQSCIPNIKNAWELVNFDVDTVLLAIRIATYGESMTVKFNVPVTNEESEHTVNVSALLDSIKNVEIKDEFKTKIGLTIKISPLRYKVMNRTQLAQFEQQKIYANVSMTELSDEEKSKQFTKSYQKLNEINFGLLAESIIEIKTPKGQVANKVEEIRNFINNCDAVLVKEIEDKLIAIRKVAQIKPLKMKATDEQVLKGAPVTYDVPLTFDNSNFFA